MILSKLLPFLVISCIVNNSTAQVLYPENDPITTYSTGFYYQSGPGGNNTSYNWTYPYGTKLTTHVSADRNFELMTLDKEGSGLVFRQCMSIGSWTPWKRLVMEDEHIRAADFVAVFKEGSYRVALNGESHGYIKGRNDNVQDKFLINSNGNSFFTGGNVGVGTTTPDDLLTVKGRIHAEEIKVNMNVPAPDYVFEEDYDLIPLAELEVFIGKNKHLPDVPSASDMAQNGLKLKEMNLLLLKKIEELTLHLIDQSKINIAQKAEIDLLKEEVQGLKNNLKRGVWK